MKDVFRYTDVELIEALKNENSIDHAIEFIYSTYYRLLEYYVIQNNGTKDDAADVIQETIIAFIEIIERGKFRGEASVNSFLHSIAKNIWLGELRKKTSRDNRNLSFEKQQEQVSEDVSAHLIYHEQQRAINFLFEELGEKCKKLLLMVYYEDLSMKDILIRMPEYQNEQVLRNKKYKCMKELQEKVQENSSLKDNLQKALRYGL